jgi:hypothetical protein
VPPPTNVTVVPVTVQTAGVPLVKATARPDVAAALTAYAAPPAVADDGAVDVKAIDCDRRSTPWLSTDDAEALKGAEPAYEAVMDREPAEGKETTQVAVPALRVWLPEEHEIADPPSRNTTVPVGVPEAEATVAVKVTACPTSDGLTELASVVVVGTDLRTVATLLSALVAVHPARRATTVQR